MGTPAPQTAPAVAARHEREGTAKGLVDIDRDGIESLSREECLRLLATATLGRVGITYGALPVVVPVNFRLVREGIVFHTGIGTTLDAATRNAVVAFEANDIEAMSPSGWSVAVTGVAREVTDPDELAELTQANIPRWTQWGGDRFVVVSTETLSGCRFVAEQRSLRSEP